MDWDSLYCADIDQHCMQWQNMFLSIMEQCIPKKVLPPKRRNRPWLNKSIIQSIRRRNAAHKRAKNSNCPTLTARYRRIRNKVSSKLRKAKQQYFSNINPSNLKQFWKSVKALDKQGTSVNTLLHNGTPCLTDEQKANALNEFFSSCYNASSQPINTITLDSDHICSPDNLCTEEEICKMLQSLDVSKANGPDGISARMLKSTAIAIAPSITNLFNHSITCGRPPSSWKMATVVPIPKKQRANCTSEFRPISLLSILSSS